VFFFSSDRQRLNDVMAAVESVQQTVTAHTKMLEALMSEQSHLDQSVAALRTEIDALTTAAASIATEIANLKSANPTVDFTALDQAVADLSTATDAVQANVPPETPPA